MRKIRCAIYTRKSTEEGLDQDFNSLDAQREACEAYIASQKHEGWVLLPEFYDDGGISGGTLERPALQRLMEKIDDGDVDQIVVYKIDRLTRSLSDFAKLVDRLDAKEASFVSVTQSFNTSTSMGRLTLNVLLSFAQFEREVTAERIRDKIAASKKKGLWMGGNVPLGYDADGRSLKIISEEAKTVQTLYDLYLEHKLIRKVKVRAEQLGLRSKRRVTSKGETKGGNFMDRGHIYHILSNPIYAGRIRHKGEFYEGQHPAIIEPCKWDRVQSLLKDKATYSRGKQPQKVNPSPLTGKLFDETGDRLTPSHSKKNGKRLRYYISHRLVKHSGEKHIDGWRLPSQVLEDQIANATIKYLKENSATKLLKLPRVESIKGINTKINFIKTANIKTFALIDKIEIAPGKLKLSLNLSNVAGLFEMTEQDISIDTLTTEFPFQTRKRGVETKLIVGHVEPKKDHVLIRNIVKAHKWFDLIKSGKSFEEIAKQEAISVRRIRQVTDFAFLAPDIVDGVLNGSQPIGLTSEWLKYNRLPNDWHEQRALIASL